MTTQTITRTSTLVVQECCACFILFAVPKAFDDARLADHNWFYCPNGHSQSYAGKTEEQKAKDRAERLAQQLASREEDLRALNASLTATKGQLTKARKRATNGVCPCCNRTFVNVQRHMASKHPAEAPALAHLAHKPDAPVSS